MQQHSLAKDCDRLSRRPVFYSTINWYPLRLASGSRLLALRIRKRRCSSVQTRPCSRRNVQVGIGALSCRTLLPTAATCWTKKSLTSLLHASKRLLHAQISVRWQLSPNLDSPKRSLNNEADGRRRGIAGCDLIPRGSGDRS